ncbi:MAG: YtxH domain-containing protein [Alkalicoccus sp.]|nr:MAG: YtxH domain-containing protein [Alkalicoccus sp.]
MSEENGINTKDFFLGTLIGALAGAVIAFLLTPASGREFREGINEQARTAKDKTSEWTNQAVEKGGSVASSAREGTTGLGEKIRRGTRSLRRNMQELTDSADYLVDDFDDLSEDIAASVRQEVEDLQRSVEELIREVEAYEKEKSDGDNSHA